MIKFEDISFERLSQFWEILKVEYRLLERPKGGAYLVNHIVRITDLREKMLEKHRISHSEFNFLLEILHPKIFLSMQFGGCPLPVYWKEIRRYRFPLEIMTTEGKIKDYLYIHIFNFNGLGELIQKLKENIRSD
jgi:hypothetical protein